MAIALLSTSPGAGDGMTPFADLGGILQVVVAFLLFVAAYLGLLLVVVIVLVIADLLYEAASLLRVSRRAPHAPVGPHAPVRKHLRWSERWHHILQH